MLHTFLYTFIIPHYESKRYIAILDSNQCLPSLFLSPKDKFLPYLNPQRGGYELSGQMSQTAAAKEFQSPKGRLQTRRELGKSYGEQMDEVSNYYKLFLLYPTSSRKSRCVKIFQLLSTPGVFEGIAGRQQLENTKMQST